MLRTLRERFEEWGQRSLAEKRVVYLLLDAIAMKVRVDRRVACVPMLVAMAYGTRAKKCSWRCA